MAVKTPLKLALTILLIGTALESVNADESLTNCDWLEASTAGCIQQIDCQTSGTVLRIWEDCQTDVELFTITNATIKLEDPCPYGYGDPTIYLKQQLDAEEDAGTKSCEVSGSELRLFFRAIDINESPPYPSSDTIPVMELSIKENKTSQEIAVIYYSDDDYGETSTLKSVLISTEYEDTFTLDEGTADEENKWKPFSFKTKIPLNFEDRAFYKVEYKIISTDLRGNKNNVSHTFFVYVVDEPDEPPFWSQIVPFFALDECQEEENLFQVTAQDRDVMVNYNIRYSFNNEESEYFEINEDTGNVSRKGPIDREELLEYGISSFTLAITATEYNATTGEDGEEPNSNEQVSVITIVDCNDETPEFNNITYEIEMDEVTVFSGNQVLGLSIVVKDMDEGDSGTFYLETDQPDQVVIDPEVGQQTQEVTLTAVYMDENSLFDYEQQGNIPFTIKITATEKTETSHTSTSTVTITLLDVNDERPVFSQTTYKASVPEGTNLNTKILTVDANDGDTSPEFGQLSIRYSLQSPCNELYIDPVNGDVTMAALLDFEELTNNLIECTVNARDEDGDGLTNNVPATIAITITDVVDEPPQFEIPGIPMEILENSNEGTPVGTFIVTDTDAKASIDFEIQQSTCLDDVDVTGWFKVKPGTTDPPNFHAELEVGNVTIDREACKEVTLIIQATDINTDDGYESESSATGSFTITIMDENDEAPVVECESGCEGISVDEDDEINPSNASVLVFKVTVTDPDEEDTISLSLSGDMMYLSKETVEVQEGSVEIVEVWTKEGVMIDCETQDTIDLEIFLADSENHNSSKKVSVKVNDLNDRRPEIDLELCGGSPIEIPEDDGSGEINGTSIGKIHATDADRESPHNNVRYMMINDQLTDSKNLGVPFTIDEETGDVTVLLIDGKKALDRELFANWELLFRAYDECDSSFTCKVLQSQPDCVVNITVKDVNDNVPCCLTWQPDTDIEVTDFLKKDDDLGYKFSAIDDDEGEFADLTYSVLGTYRPQSDFDMDLFRAVDEPFTTPPSCRLYANQDFEGKNFTGEYTVILEAKDGGDKKKEFNITIYVNDANDEVPYFTFGGCDSESEENIITMEENAYKPGEDGESARMEVKCDGPRGEDFIIEFEDSDKDKENRESIVNIDMENSTVQNLGDNADEQTLLSYWSLEPENCERECRLYISHIIDREEGTAYNLSLHITNTATPKKESWASVLVFVTNLMEHNPFFCTTGHCSQVVYMEENSPAVSAHFDKATDEDNNGVSSGDPEYNKVFYHIVGGDKDYFQLISDSKETIVLKSMPNGLDREEKDEYFLQILANNDASVGDEDIGDSPRNDTLNLIIRVRDVNDENPGFSDDVIFTSFMETTVMDTRISTIEAIDLDLNETLTYKILDDLEWFENDFTPVTPFRLDIKNDRSVYLTMNFTATGMTRGYCNFTISVEDLYGHMDETTVKVYVINEGHQVDMYFSNALDEVQSKQDQIAGVYSSVYQYECTIDNIEPTKINDDEILPNKTTVNMHFIDEEKNEPVEDKIILDLSDNAELMGQLLDRLNLIGIQLDSVDTYLPPTDDKNPEETIRELQILLGVVSLVLGLFLLLLAMVYWLRTNKLQRKIKVLSTNTFGSKDEGLDQMGIDMASVPGSNNLAKVHGNHNPVFSESGGLELKNQDAESISSGDSVLVGVEDNPEFKSYSSKGFENPSYGRSIDDVSAALPGVQGGMKGNPLLNIGGSKGEPRLSATSEEISFDGDSLESQDDAAAVDQNMNFSF